MTQDLSLIARIGQALYGQRWYADMARLLGVSDRTVRRWDARTADIPDGVWVDLHEQLRQRYAEISALLEEAR